MKNIFLFLLILFSKSANSNDWPQACYNETSMWVTNACKSYIETVYSAAPGPELGTGIVGIVLVIVALLLIYKTGKAYDKN